MSILNRQARLNDRNIDKVDECDATCRKKLGCMLDYAVNEFEMLCLDYDFNYYKSWYYFIGALQNPWVDKKTYTPPEPPAD